MRASRAVLGICLALVVAGLPAKDWYISAARSSGRQGTREAPAKDLGNIASALAPGDRVFVAGGFYTGKGDSGADVINVPVSLSGGWSDDFSARDPWGAHQSIMSGDNKTANWVQAARIEMDLSKYRGPVFPIGVEGFIIDQGPQNRYKDASGLLLVRQADPASGSNPSPDRGGIMIRVTMPQAEGASWDIRVRDNVLVNCAASVGALSVCAYAQDKVTIGNNAIINCTGTGIYAGTSWRGSDRARAPRFLIQGNTVMFAWKYDPYAQSYSGEGLSADAETRLEITGNLIAFCDRFSLLLKGSWPALLKGNILAWPFEACYYEAYNDMRIDLEDLADEAEMLDPASGGNGSGPLRLAAGREWLEAYAARPLDKAALRPALRAALGLSGSAAIPAGTEVWLPRMPVDEALRIAAGPSGPAGIGSDIGRTLTRTP
jgi:hypothetical protein